MTVVIKGLKKDDVIGLRATYRENVTVLPPHGRLIDAYELAIEILKLQKYRFSIEDPEIFVSRKAVMQAIKDEHAIIEAEVSE